MKPVLTDSELDAIKSSIESAEHGVSGEIVPYVVARSDNYEAVVWRGAAAATALFLLFTMAVNLLYEGWEFGWLFTGLGVSVGIAVSALAGVLLTLFNGAVFRLLAGERLLTARCRARANRAFIEEGVFQTAGRTGILIFVSVREHRIQVVADEGIASKVEEAVWAKVVDAVAGSLRRGRLAEALEAGVTECGRILSSAGLEAADTENELGDELRFGDS